MAPLIRQRFDNSDLPGQRARRIIENRRVDWVDGKEGPPLDEQDLEIVERGIPGTRALDQDEERLLDASRTIRDLRQRERKMRRKMAIGAATAITIIAVIASALGVFAWQQRNLAQGNLKLAKDNAIRAMENFTMARNAVDDYYSEISQYQLLNEPGMQELRQLLLTKAIDFHDQFVARNQDDATVDLDMARAHLSLGKIQNDLGDRDSAQSQFDSAFEVLNNLAPSDRESEELQAVESDVLIAKGRIYYLNANWSEAIAAYQQASSIRQKLVEVDTANPKRGRQHANAIMNMGLVLHSQSEDEQDSANASKLRQASYAKLKEANAIRDQYLQVKEDEKIRRDLGKGCLNAAILRFDDLVSTESDDDDQWSEASALIQRAVDTFKALHDGDNENIEYQFELAKAYTVKGDYTGVDSKENDA